MEYDDGHTTTSLIPEWSHCWRWMLMFDRLSAVVLRSHCLACTLRRLLITVHMCLPGCLSSRSRRNAASAATAPACITGGHTNGRSVLLVGSQFDLASCREQYALTGTAAPHLYQMHSCFMKTFGVLAFVRLQLQHLSFFYKSNRVSWPVVSLSFIVLLLILRDSQFGLSKEGKCQTQ